MFDIIDENSHVENMKPKTTRFGFALAMDTSQDTRRTGNVVLRMTTVIAETVMTKKNITLPKPAYACAGVQTPTTGHTMTYRSAMMPTGKVRATNMMINETRIMIDSMPSRVSPSGSGSMNPATMHRTAKTMPVILRNRPRESSIFKIG